MVGRTVLLVAALALVAAAPAAAKEGVEARLVSPAALEAAAPGEEVVVEWTLTFVDEDGARQPFNAEGVFVRLFSAAGAEPQTGRAAGGAHATGEYRATVVVPEGGIGALVIGLGGTASGPTGSWASNAYFPVVNSPFPATAPTVAASAPASPAAGDPDWPVPVALGSLAAVALLAGGLLVRRRRHAATA